MVISLMPLTIYAQVDSTLPLETNTKSKKWDWVDISGYTQLRYNELFETNPNLECEQCDKSWGTGVGLYFRRLRFSFDFHLNPQLTFTIQPDFGGLIEGGTPVTLRDMYFEYRFDKKKNFA